MVENSGAAKAAETAEVVRTAVGGDSNRTTRWREQVGAAAVGGFALFLAPSVGAQTVPTPIRNWMPPEISQVPATVIAKMRRNGEYPANPSLCPVQPQELRAVTAVHRTFRGSLQLGQILVHESVAEEVAKIMIDLYLAGVPIEQMVPGLTEQESMKSNNTTGFSCGAWAADRFQWGAVSAKNQGLAVDINPWLNPAIRPTQSALPEFDVYVSSHLSKAEGYAEVLNEFCAAQPVKCVVVPAVASQHIARDSSVKGMVVSGGELEKVFTSYGWSWGGYLPKKAGDRIATQYYRFERQGH